MSSRALSSTSGPTLAPRSDVHFLPGDDCDHVVLVNDRGGRGLDDLAAVADPHDEDPGVLGQRLDFRHGLVHQIRVGHAVRADIEEPRRRDDAESQLGRARDLGLHPRAFLAQVDPHQLRPDRGKEPDEAGGSDEVGHGIGDRNVVQQRGLLRIRNRQALDRLTRGADHRGLRERPRQQARGRPDVVSEKLREPECREQAGDAQDDRERHLGKGVALQPAKELRSDLVPGGEEEEIEEDRLHDRPGP